MLRIEPDDNLVLQPNRLHQRPKIVETVGAAVENPKHEIDFGWCENGNRGR
jgi:hypothetical protein